VPPVLDREAIESGLAGETPTLSRSVNEDLRFVPVTSRMNKPAYNRPDCIEPLADETALRVLSRRSARRGSFHASSTPKQREDPNATAISALGHFWTVVMTERTRKPIGGCYTRTDIGDFSPSAPRPAYSTSAFEGTAAQAALVSSFELSRGNFAGIHTGAPGGFTAETSFSLPAAADVHEFRTDEDDSVEMSGLIKIARQAREPSNPIPARHHRLAGLFAAPIPDTSLAGRNQDLKCIREELSAAQAGRLMARACDILRIAAAIAMHAFRRQFEHAIGQGR
jgi:hypothetical protein